MTPPRPGGRPPPCRAAATSAPPSSAAGSSARCTSRRCAGSASTSPASSSSIAGAGRAGAPQELGRRRRPTQSLDELLADDRVAGRPRHLAQRAPLPAGEGDPRRRPARGVREAAGDDLRRSPASWSRSRRRAASSTPSTSTSGSTRSTSTSRRWSRDGGWATSAWSPAATSRTGCCSTRTGTGASSRTRAARCARSATSAPTGWTSRRFLTGLRVEAVMADLTTFIPVRQQARRARSRRSPRSARRTPSRWRSTPRTSRRSCCGSRAAPAGSVAISPASARAARTASQYEIDGSSSAVAWDSEQPEQLWIGHRDRPNELLLRNPALMNGAGGRGRPPARRPRGGLRRHVRRLFTAIYDDVLAGRPSDHAALRDLRRRPRGDAGRRRGRSRARAPALGRGRTWRRRATR